MAKIFTTRLIQFPTGSWGFVGSVPLALGFVRKADGSTPTEAEVKQDARMPGSPRFRTCKTRS